ncbi:MAG TPA: patatin-like phospholipase family protein [Solirubrobacteraceae bacterium]|nr:patatin-like phospholipase family protein [Solirubrobacteraceae bacterium]
MPSKRRPPAQVSPRVGLVLGAGGILGSAWLIGALTAIAAETGWDPGTADYIVGTSAGSVVGALLASGVPPWLMLAHTAGELLDEPAAADAADAAGDAGTAAPADRSAGAAFRLDRGGLALGPGSWRLALASLARPYRYSPMAVVSGWLPRGIVSTEPLKATVRRACADPWAPHPNFWAVAVDYTTGRRTAFGRQGSPPAQLDDAVAASCAIPGFYRPVKIGGRPYVDGGVHSTSNLDILRREPLDLVVALNPMSSLHAEATRHPAERLALRMRQAAGRRLGAEARRLREAGMEVVLIQPTVQDLDVMGANLMSARRRREVTHTAVETVTRELRHGSSGARLAALPAGDPRFLHRPAGPPGGWPDFRELARSRWRVARAA